MTVMKARLLGKDIYDDFDPSYDKDEHFDTLKSLGKHLGISTLVSPVCGFTNTIVNGTDRLNLTVEFGIHRSIKLADGAILDMCNEGVVIFNADCPVIGVMDRVQRQLAVLHGGFRCLIPEKPRRGPRPKGIIQTLFENFAFDPVRCQAFFGFGIGPCCYGAEHLRELDDDLTLDLPIGRATRGARKGQRSIDLYELIHGQLVAAKLRPESISWNARCTACAGTHFPNEPKYHSHTRQAGNAGRNASIIWMADK